MATVPELFVAVFATASVVLLATILHHRSLRQPLKPAETSAPKTKKSLTLRIDEIPADHIDNLDRNLKSILGKILDLRGDAKPMACRSLVSHGKDSLCATISINTLLSADDLSAQLYQAGQAHPYKYTCKFKGVTPLYEDKNGADIDIIAVPGLGSHALGSWKSPNSDDVWLRDFLPKDVPNIWVLLYGYDTSLQGSLSNQSIEDLGGEFLEKIIAFRANDGPNAALIHDLVVNSDSEPSTSLKRQAREFSEDCKCYHVVTFYKCKHNPLLKKQDGKLVKSGSYSLLVTEKSASSIGLVAVAEEDKVPLNTDHSGLVKYESRSQDDYTIIRERLRRLVDEARLEVAKRLVENSLLWIKGKPGSGKSTLMKYAKDALPPIYGTNTLVFSFFFYSRGHELQRTPIGLFRSLLHQLLKCDPSAVPDLIKYFEDKRTTEGEPGEKWQWHLQPLQAFLKSSLLIILKRFPVILFIDALDECGKQPAAELIGYLKDLLSRLPPTNSRFGIFFSCRHYPILELDSRYTILLDTQNAQDIITFVHLVLKQVLLLHLEGESTAQIEAEIGRIPQNLNGLYSELIKAMKHRSTALKLVQWICCSTRPLTTDELQWAMVVDPDCIHKSLDEYQNSDEFIADDKIDRRINALSCGLAEIVQSRNARVVQFIHQSVKDFFVEGGLKALDNTTKAANLVIPAVHCRLSRSCIRYFRMVVLSQSGSLGEEDKSRFPLLHYATTSWVSHMKLGDPAEVSPNDLLDLLGWPTEPLIESWVRIYKALERYAGDCPSSGSNLVHIVARHGLTKLLSCLLLDTGKVDVDATDTEYGRTPLLWAAEKGHEAVVKLLLDTGKVDVDTRDKYGRTPLLRAAENGHKAVVKLLLDTGKVDVDARDKNGRTPLWWAARKGRKAEVKMLLDTGKVNVDARDIEYSRTPLSQTAGKGYEAVVKMLLDTGKVDVNARDAEYGRMPLLWAAGKGRKAVVKLLLNTGKVDVNTRDRNGQTPLLWAAERGDEAVVKLLLDTGKVDVDAEDFYGLTAYQLSVFNHHEQVEHQLAAQGVLIPSDFYGLQSLFAELSSRE
ncbi:hypothetical protein IL306_009926 [Fusarium sp. DS 682]|nr:hypothetical protein IL306_009926 [Fusarium sp. DS 682]